MIVIKKTAKTDAVKSLYLVTTSGKLLELKQGKHDKPHQPGFIRTYAQICPTSMLSMTKLNAEEYAQYITRSRHSKWVPKLFFTQIELPIDTFLKEFEESPFVSPPFVHPAKLRDSILELRNTDKEAKGISLNKIIWKKFLMPKSGMDFGLLVTKRVFSFLCLMGKPSRRRTTIFTKKCRQKGFYCIRKLWISASMHLFTT